MNERTNERTNGGGGVGESGGGVEWRLLVQRPNEVWRGSLVCVCLDVFFSSRLAPAYKVSEL